MYEAQLAAIAMAVRHGELVLRQHARDQERARGITPTMIASALSVLDAEMIEDYPHDPRGGCCLIRSVASGRALHLVVSYPPFPEVITAYWPDSQPAAWDAEFRRRQR